MTEQNQKVSEQIQYCPAGGAHDIEKDFTCCGVTCGILFFPLGLLCCFLMRKPTCQKCDMRFG
jgi:hypothetical protein